MRRSATLLLLLLAMLVTAFPAAAQQGSRVALVVGVGAYRAIPALANPPNDARAMAETLTRIGFQTELVLDPDRFDLEQAVRRLGQRAVGAEAALFFYAGHALEHGGQNWLLPASTNIRNDRDLRFEGLDLDTVISQLEPARISILLLDGCRDNPFRLRLASATRGIATGPGLTPVRAAVGTLIAFATAPGEVAEDGAGEHSPFSAALLSRIATPGLELRAMMADVRRLVREATGGRQVPWEHSALEGAFYFVPAQASPAPVAAATPPEPMDERVELLFWESVRNGGTPADYRAYLDRFPQGVFAGLARARLAQQDRTAAAGPPVALPMTPAAPPATNTPRLEPAAITTAPALPEAKPGEEQAGVLPVLVRPPPAPPPAPPTAAELARAVPHVSSRHAMQTAQGYLASPGPNRALAVNPERRTGFRVQGFSSAEDAEATLLERCQLTFGTPCLLVAVNDTIQGSDQISRRRDMPRVAYQGRYDPEQVPGVSSRRRPETTEIMTYRDQAGAKAMALHPQGRVTVVSGARSESDAAQRALTACRAIAQRERLYGSCYIYAMGEDVVLSRRLTAPPR